MTKRKLTVTVSNNLFHANGKPQSMVYLADTYQVQDDGSLLLSRAAKQLVSLPAECWKSFTVEGADVYRSRCESSHFASRTESQFIDDDWEF